MFKAIDQVQRQYTYAVQPVQLFETKKSDIAQKSSFDFINQMVQNGHNPFHPDVSNTKCGNKLDFLG